MPFNSIPFAVVAYGNPGQPAAPLQGQVLAGMWPVLVQFPPQPVERYDLASLYLPIGVQASQAVAGVPPTICRLTPQLFLSGVPVLAQALILDLYPLAGNPGFVGGTDTIGISAQNTIAYRAGQTLQLGFQAQFDQSCGGANIFMAGIITNPTTGLVTESRGTIGYYTSADDAVLTA